MRCQQHFEKPVTQPSFDKENEERKVDEFISTNRNKNNTNKTRQDAKTFTTFLRTCEELGNIEDIPFPELDAY